MIKCVRPLPNVGAKGGEILAAKCPKCPHKVGTVNAQCNCACHTTPAGEGAASRHGKAVAKAPANVGQQPKKAA